MKGKFLRFGMLFVMLGIVALVYCGRDSDAAVANKKTVKLGTSYRISSSGAKFSSSDTDTAYVDADGLVTAKKIGTATIKVKNGTKTTKQKLTVKANAKKKRSIKVSTGEINIIRVQALPDTSTTTNETGESEVKDVVTVSVEIKNVSKNKSGKIILNVKVDGISCRLESSGLGAGDSKTLTKTVNMTLSEEYDSAMVTPVDLTVYSNKMYTKYFYEKDETKFYYGTKDTKAPVISGFVGKNSYNQDMPFMVVYSDDINYNYFKYVKATDDRDTKVKLTVDTSKVNFKKAGKYKITYKAVDKAGNVAEKTAKIQVRKTKDIDRYADQVLSGIIKKDWSDFKKAVAIYNYTRRHISYVGYSNKSSWEKEAAQGIAYGKGDCFTYYAVARALLTRAGIPNIKVTRYRGAGHHWWNMVYVKGGWYHYDCGPRPGGGRFCLLTDDQLTAYSRSHGNKYIWNYKVIPKSPKKKLTSVF